MCARVCVYACVRVCVCACVRACVRASAEHHITRSCNFSGSIGLKVEKSMGVRICWAKQNLLHSIHCTVHQSKRNKLACIIRGSGKSPNGMPFCTEICSRHLSCQHVGKPICCTMSLLVNALQILYHSFLPFGMPKECWHPFVEKILGRSRKVAVQLYANG